MIYNNNNNNRPLVSSTQCVFFISYKVIISLDPLLTNFLASGNLAIKSLGTVYRLIVSVERLSPCEWGWPGIIGCITSIRETAASVWTSTSDELI